ncbi:hypothetical protein LAZ67_10000121 [Cordylochernes scorpioides]|uniref:Mos1 transposase HTH domain-containing protein n=1 Tax=Cordylochernes scorpioides TaxID=51811 RepID=A0ABY6KYK7_9ARAC|nr:hypothetical protein LAZ67_10000121 [Cordylochernes scorpioides]
MILVKDAQNFRGLMKMCKNYRFDKRKSSNHFAGARARHRHLQNNDWKDRNQRFEAQKDSCKIHPKIPHYEPKLCWLATCEDMMEMTRMDPEWKVKIITGDETWVYGYDPETKRQSAEWRGKRFEKKRPEKGTNGDWILHHDNARPHTAHLVTSFLAKNGTQILPQPPYSPDIAPNDFFLFPKLKAVLKGRHFDTRDDIIEKSLLALKSIPKEAYKNCFDNWEKRWRWCVEAIGGVLDRLRFLPIKKMDQRTCIKFCVKNEIKCADAFRMLTVAYGEATLDRSNVYRWYKMFSEGRVDVNDEERAGRPSTPTTDEKINEVEKMILANRRITVREVAEDLNISIGSCHSIFINDLGMRRVAAKFVQKLLNCDQKQHRMNIANEMLDSVRDDPNLLQRVITGGHNWLTVAATSGLGSVTKLQHQFWQTDKRPPRDHGFGLMAFVSLGRTLFHEIHTGSNGILTIYQRGVLDRLRFLPIKKMDKRTCIKFCVKNEIKCADAFRMLTVAYGEATLDRSNVYRWYKMFSEGREDVNDEERARRPSTSTTDEKINEVEKMIFANRRITVKEVAEDLNISIGSCHSIFINDLGMRRVAAKFVPKLLNCDQKQHRMNIANEMLDSVRDDPNLLQRVITGGEAWVYGYDVENKAQSSQWKLPHEPRPKKARQVRSNVKVLLIVFLDCRGVVHHEFLPQGRTANKEYYLQVMRNLREAIRQKRPDLWKNKNWLLHHNNAPAHTSLLVRDFLAKNNTLMMPRSHRIPQIWPPVTFSCSLN